MTPDQINRACAELCGWKLAKSAYGDYEVLYRPDGSECRHCYNSGDWETLISFGQAIRYKKLPDFTASLDAAQMAFKALTEEQKKYALYKLWFLLFPSSDACPEDHFLLEDIVLLMLATPLQWCEAILRAAGRWVE